MVQSKSYYDQKENWTAAGIWKAPEFDVESYQKKLNKICEVSVTGQPIVRLVWAWNERKWENTDWDFAGNAIKGEWRQKYRALTVEIGNDEYVDISPPRWILEERFEPGQYVRSWEASRYRVAVTEDIPAACRHCHSFEWIDSYASEGPNLVCKVCRETTVLRSVKRDIWGQAPREGWYNLLASIKGPPLGIVAEHFGGCCKEARDNKDICYGFYKTPSNKELSILRRAVSMRDRNKESNPHAELSQTDLEHARAWGLQTEEEIKFRERSELKGRFKEEVLVHGAKVVPEIAIRALLDARRRVPKEFTRFT
jgi:hypothetical protein